jgi:hypothetical protein
MIGNPMCRCTFIQIVERIPRLADNTTRAVRAAKIVDRMARLMQSTAASLKSAEDEMKALGKLDIPEIQEHPAIVAAIARMEAADERLRKVLDGV